jgi:3-hydroxybutyrate dehydrogenase
VRVLVTGAASGIGRAVAARFESDGASVLAVDLEPAPEGPGEPLEADLVTRAGNRAAVAAAHALVASPFKAAYVAAKHGVRGLVKTLTLEGAERGILATAVCPDFVRTPLVEQQVASQAEAHDLPEERVLEDVVLAPHAVERLIEPEEVAFLAGPGGRAFTRVAVPVDLGRMAR